MCYVARRVQLYYQIYVTAHMAELLVYGCKTLYMMSEWEAQHHSVIYTSDNHFLCKDPIGENSVFNRAMTHLHSCEICPYYTIVIYICCHHNTNHM